jgi:hypothetical protein
LVVNVTISKYAVFAEVSLAWRFVRFEQSHVQQDVYGKGMESANNDARKWPILPFDVSRDFIIGKLLNIYIKNCHMIVRYMITCFGTTFETFTEIESLQGPTTLYGRLAQVTLITTPEVYNIIQLITP